MQSPWQKWARVEYGEQVVIAASLSLSAQTPNQPGVLDFADKDPEVCFSLYVCRDVWKDAGPLTPLHASHQPSGQKCGFRDSGTQENLPFVTCLERQIGYVGDEWGLEIWSQNLCWLGIELLQQQLFFGTLTFWCSSLCTGFSRPKNSTWGSTNPCIGK